MTSGFLSDILSGDVPATVHEEGSSSVHIAPSTNRREQARSRRLERKNSKKYLETNDGEEDVSISDASSSGRRRIESGKGPTPPSRYTAERPRLRPELAEELRKSFINRSTRAVNHHRPKIQPEFFEEFRQSVHERNTRAYDHHRPKLRPGLFEELRQSVHDRNARAYEHHRPKLRPELFEELTKSFHSKSTRAFDRRQEIKARIMKRRNSHRALHESLSIASFAEDSETDGSPFEDNVPHKSHQQSHRSLVSGESASTSGSFVDHTILPTEHSADFKFPGGSKPENAEWTRLLREKKNSDKLVTRMSQEIENLRSESKDLRKQLAKWQEKVSSISARHSEDRRKFDNSTDMIAKARQELTKTLNENLMLKGKFYQLQMNADVANRRIVALNETVDLQATKISSMNHEMQDKEAELRHFANEKRRLEEEVSVITASRDNKSISQVLQQLEEARSGWLEERERALESKRLVLDAENNRIIERGSQLHQKVSEQSTQATQVREMELEEVQTKISSQLEELKATNIELRDQVVEDRMENKKEMKKKEHMITMIEQEVAKLRRKLAASQLREQENEALLAEIENNSEELARALKRNIQLEKQIRKLRRQKESHGNEKSEGNHDWKEIILPGYKHLRGVTFGAPSDELAGFLTILVEDQKAKKSHSKSELQKEVRRYLKELSNENGAGDQMTIKQQRSGKTRRSSRKVGDRKSTRTLPKRKEKTRKPIDIEDFDWSSRAKKSVEQLTRELERELEKIDEEEQHSVKKSRLRKRRKEQAKKKSSRKSSIIRKEKDTKKKRRRRSNDSSSSPSYRKSRHRKKRRSDSAKVKHKTKEVPTRKRKHKVTAGRRLSRDMTLDENLEMLAQLETISHRLAMIPDPDDISLVVMKRNHKRKQSKKSKSEYRRAGRLRQGEHASFTPPAIIALQ